MARAANTYRVNKPLVDIRAAKRPLPQTHDRLTWRSLVRRHARKQMGRWNGIPR